MDQRAMAFPVGKSPRGKKKLQTFNRKHKFNIATKFCLAFCRTGHCKKGVKCPFSHNLEKVAICKKFLYGKCKAVKCFLSHNLTPDNMPDCNFFLKGYCKEENCRYRHVKVNASAGICKDFFTGFCSKGAQCESSHQFLCKSFYKTGQCPKGAKCSLAHQRAWLPLGNNVRRSPSTGPSSAVASDISDPTNLSKYRKVNSTATASSTAASTATKPNREMLNSLLTRRLRYTSESYKQIVCRDSVAPKIDSSTEYIALSTTVSATSTLNQDASSATPATGSTSSTSQKALTTTKTNNARTEPKKGVGKYPSQSSSSVQQSTTGGGAGPSAAKRAKYFVVDNDEEKQLCEYLEASATSTSVDSICRPQLKIIPDFLLESK